MIRFNADYYRLLAPFASTEETRYYLNGIHVRPHHDHGVLLTVTDGHRLVVIWDEQGKADEAAIIKLTPDALKACKPARLESRYVEIEGDKATVFAVYKDTDWSDGKPVGVASGVLVDGTYPNVEQVVSQVGQNENPGFDTFNSSYIESFGKLGKALNSSMRIISKDKGTAALILFPSQPRIYGVLMPMRGGNEGEEVPAWYFKPNTEEEVAA